MILDRRNLLFAAVLCAPRLVSAMEPPVSSSDAPPPDTSDYEQVVYLLKRGRRYEKAAELLVTAQTKAPQDCHISSALGCACAGRVASLCYAAWFAGELARQQTAYPKAFAEWQAAQKNPKADGYGDPRPIAPTARTFPTKDDGIPYRLTPEQLKTKASALAKRAREAFVDGERLAQTPDAKAEAAHLQGWGLRILAIFSSEHNDFQGLGEEGETPTTLFPKPTDKEIVDALRRATDAAPEVAVYWRSLGDAQSEADSEKSYRRYLTLEPRDASVWFRLYNRAASDEKKRVQALADLRQAIRYDSANATLHYEEAVTLLKGTSFSSILAATGPDAAPHAYQTEASKAKKADAREAATQAIAAVLRGNDAAEMRVMSYKENVPRLLAPAWEYSAMLRMELPGYGRLRELARALGGLALIFTREDKDVTSGRNTSRAIIGIGARLAKDWAVSDEYAGDSRVLSTLVGKAIVAIGYKTLLQVEEVGGSPTSLEIAQNEYDAYKQKSDEHRKILQAFFASPDAVFGIY